VSTVREPSEITFDEAQVCGYDIRCELESQLLLRSYTAV
jgi:hypothetical protein